MPPPARACSDGSVAWDPAASLADNLERDLTLLALVGIEDPLRPEVPAAIASCQRAGITVKMLTGDNAGTAAAIARQCGILPPAEEATSSGSSTSSSSSSRGPAHTRQQGLAAAPREEAAFAVMEGSEFRRRVLAPDGSIRAGAFLEIWPQLRVLARCTPADKFAIVRGERQGRGEGKRGNTWQPKGLRRVALGPGAIRPCEGGRDR